LRLVTRMSIITGVLRWDIFVVYIIFCVIFVGCCCFSILLMFYCCPAKESGPPLFASTASIALHDNSRLPFRSTECSGIWQNLEYYIRSTEVYKNLSNFNRDIEQATGLQTHGMVVQPKLLLHLSCHQSQFGSTIIVV
jgi:hypothetical protein